jgi:hypothetical protein
MFVTQANKAYLCQFKMRFLPAIFALLVLIACEDVRQVSSDNFRNEVVLNSIISPDSSWNVHLSYTKSIFDEADFSYINDASVRVLSLTSGQSFFLDNTGGGHYYRDSRPAEGHEYKLEVQLPDREDVLAFSYVPEVIDVAVGSRIVANGEGDTKLEINLEITDNPDEENYYVWELLEVDPVNYALEHERTETSDALPDNDDDASDSTSSSGDISNESGGGTQVGGYQSDDQIPTEFKTEHIFSFNSVEQQSKYQRKELNDLSFLSEADVKAGKIANKLILDSSFISEIDSDYVFEEQSDDQLGRKPIFELKVMVVSSELFEYLKTYEEYRQNEIKNTSISEPVKVYSNIENGLGIFGGYSLKRFYIY